MKPPVILFLFFITLFSCGRKEEKKQSDAKPEAMPGKSADDAGWENIRGSIVKFDSYDGNRILETGQGYFIDKNLIVTTYSVVKNATRVVFTPLNETKTYVTEKYVAIDRINDLVILQCDSISRTPLELHLDSVPQLAKSMYILAESGKTVQLFTGKVLNRAKVKGNEVYRITNKVRKSFFGMPVFLSNRKVLGSAFSAVENYEEQSFAIPADYISNLHKTRSKVPSSLASLSRVDEKTAAENRNIKGLVLETSAGNITIRLFNETPEYRDNFIRLTKEKYFDGLLFHRVIAEFGIQSGAPDSRNARKGDVIGYKGPGYTLPAHFNTSLYHKRGMIGSPRKPDNKNERLRSDGSQFYIVTGRKYNDIELDALEKQNKYKFSAEQREYYKTIGGAPHLDGSYTVFGEVVEGMEIADEIVKAETDREWRPVKDIKLKKVSILK
jgi:cyclophilin family peptidyl-prolyl cis-trans isomerase